MRSQETINAWAQAKRDAYREEQRAVWEKHNPARNVAHADYSNPRYVENRIAADEAWWQESEKVWEKYSKTP